MTELKDGIKKITSSWGKDNGLKFLVTTDEMDDLAQRIAEALVVDEEFLEEIVKKTLKHNINHQLGLMGMNKNIEPINLLKAISEAKPIKCEVGS